MRINKYIAKSGVCSRRKAEKLVKQGRIKVNNELVTNLATRISKDDVVTFDSKVIKPETKKVYIMLNKPEGYVSTVKDQFNRKTVMDLLPDDIPRIYPIGRLDYDSEGLILLTNDGNLTQKISHPRHELAKEYQVFLDGVLNKDKIYILENGVEIDEGMTSPAKITNLKRHKNTTICNIIIHEGMNRQVRKMFYSVGLKVLRLKRVRIGHLTLGDLKLGEWKYFSPEEVIGK